MNDEDFILAVHLCAPNMKPGAFEAETGAEAIADVIIRAYDGIEAARKKMQDRNMRR